MKKLAGKRLAVIAGGLSVVLAASVAFAAWTATGGGSGSAKAITATPLTTVDASASTTAQLYPGGTGDLQISFHNPNPYAVTVTAVNYDGTSYISSDKGANCTDAPASTHPTGVTLTNSSGWSFVVPAASDAGPFTVTGKVSMSNTSDNGCQGATFTIPVTVSGHSN